MVDQNAPQYLAYLEECHMLKDVYSHKMGAIMERQAREYFRGMDDLESNDLNSWLLQELKVIKKKYGYE